MGGKLHIFQRTMLLWDEIHPYNAVHVIRIPRPLDRQRLTSIIQQRLEMYLLTGFVLDRKRRRFFYRGGAAAVDIKIVEHNEETPAALDNEIELQINKPFPMEGVITPFRFFILKEEHFFYLGLVYLHIISDAESIVYFIKSIVNTYMGKNGADIQVPIRHYPFSLRRMLQFNIRHLTSWLLTLPSHVADLRQSCRVSYTDINNCHISFTSVNMEPSQFHALVKASKRWGVTMNDILISILLLSISFFASKRLSSRRRRKISVASIVNIRKDLHMDIQRPFGLYLGSFVVSHTVPQGITLDHLAKEIHEQTEKIKRHKLYLRSLIEQLLALALIPLFPQEHQRKFYAKYYPLWGGISNINLNNLWDLSKEENHVEYLRAVSTNPVVPLVLSLTTVGDTFNIGFSFRDAVFTRYDRERLVREILRNIQTIETTL